MLLDKSKNGQLNMSKLVNNEIPSTEENIKSIKYFSAFKYYMSGDNVKHLTELTNEEFQLCKIVGQAYAQHNSSSTKQEIMKTAMQLCKGSLNPSNVYEMINSTYNFYYERS